jgi:hypothetical protein
MTLAAESRKRGTKIFQIPIILIMQSLVVEMVAKIRIQGKILHNIQSN